MKVLIAEGGAMRGVFSAGVLKAFTDSQKLNYDLYLGVSAGACNLASVLGENYERNLGGYSKLMTQKRFISFKRFLKGGHFMDLDWLWKELNSHYSFNEKLINQNKKNFHIVVTNVQTGKPEYLIPNSRNIHEILLASSAIPLAYKGFVELDGKLYTDGGLSDPLPVQYAIDRGATEITIIRTKSILYRDNPDVLNNIWKTLLWKRKALRKALSAQHKIYNQSVNLIHNPPGNVRIKQVFPENKLGTGRFTQDSEIVLKDFLYGLQQGKKFIEN